MIKGVIFDFDGIIVDSEYISYKIYRDFLKQYDIVFTLDDYKKFCPGKQLIKTMNFFKEHFKLDYDLSQAIAYFRQRERYYLDSDGVALKKGVIELLAFLKQYHCKIALATSSVKYRALEILDQYHLTSYFDEFVFGDEVKRGKPFPDVFNIAQNKINLEKDELIIVEDSEAGIEAASRAGIKVVCIPDMKYPDESYQKMTFKIYPDLTYIIEYLKTEWGQDG